LIKDRLIQLGNLLTIDDIIHIRDSRILSEDSIYDNAFNIKNAIKNIENNGMYTIYMMKIYFNNVFTNIVKIGYSNNIYIRSKNITKSIKKNVNISYKVIPYMVIKNRKNKTDAIIFEKTLHSLLWKQKYKSSNMFDGSTELFNYESWMDNLFDVTVSNVPNEMF
jgi:hypothetical protein